MQFTITALYLFVCFLLVLVVLLQRGKDASGDLFGVGANAVLSIQGTTSFLTRMTSVLGLLFFLLSVLLGYTINRSLHENRIVNVPIVLPDSKAETKGGAANATKLAKTTFNQDYVPNKKEAYTAQAKPKMAKQKSSKMSSRAHPKAVAVKKVGTGK